MTPPLSPFFLPALLLLWGALLSPGAAQQAATDLSAYWSGGAWAVTAGPPVCDQSSCCCFTDAVNIFATPATGELNLNGSVLGVSCNRPVKQDSIDPPTTLSVAEEFFGIDAYTFTLANATAPDRGLTLTATDSSPGGSCSFQLGCPTCSPINPNWQPTVSVPTPTTMPPSAALFVGEWQFDGTCPASYNAACCCLVGNASIFPDPGGEETFHVVAAGSPGCRLASGVLEEDDFPWPSGNASATTVDGFLVNQDTYIITLQQEGQSSSSSLTFRDMTVPACSLRATRPGAATPSPPVLPLGSTIVFGRSSSREGTYTAEGAAMEVAFNFWVNWTNAVLGGIRLGSIRYPVALLQYNDASDPTLIPLIYQHLTGVDSVSALFSPFASALTTVAERHTGGLPFLFAGSTVNSLYGAIPNAFGMSPPSSLRSVSCMGVMAGAGAQTMSVVYTAGDAFNTQAAASVMQLGGSQGMHVLSNDSFVSGSSDFSALIAKWRSLNPHILVISGTSPDPWTIIRAVRQANWWPHQIYIPTASTLEITQQEAAGAGESWALENVVSSDTWRPDQPGADPFFGSAAGFAAAYTAATNQTPVSTYVSAVAAGYVLTSAIEAAGSLDPASVVAALRATDLSFWYGRVTFGVNGAPGMSYTCVQVQDGSPRTVTAAAALVYPALSNAPAGFYDATQEEGAGSSGAPGSDWTWKGIIIGVAVTATLAGVALLVVRRLYAVHFVAKEAAARVAQSRTHAVLTDVA